MKAMSKFKVLAIAMTMASSTIFGLGAMPLSASNITVFEGNEAVGTWQFALATDTAKNGGTFDGSVISEDGYFYLTYQGEQSDVQLVLQSWSGGAGWVTVKPSEEGILDKDTYYAKFDYAAMSAVYGTNFAALDKFYVLSITEPITICSLVYKDGQDAVDPVEPTDPVDPVEPTDPVDPVEPTDPSDPVTPPSEDVKDLVERHFEATAENVKLLGRSYYYKDALWLAASASGVEYTFEGTKASVTILGDNVATSSWGQTSRARVGVFVNGELVADELITKEKQTIDILNSETIQKATVRIVKLSESANSTFGIGDLCVTSTSSIKPTAPKAHSIEFIGDSITCGYGVDHEGVGGGFTTATENATKTYAYKTAENLDADYSFVSYSGYGVISGYTSNGEKATSSLVAPYYDKVGFSYGYFNSEVEVATVPWDFAVEPDVVVINLGTNDSSYCGNDTSKQAEFTEGYVDFIKMVREKNPNATIICTLGIMGDTLYPCIKEAVTKYTNETGDQKVASMKFAVQAYNDGYATDYHPTEKTHQKAAQKLTTYIEAVMGW